MVGRILEPELMNGPAQASAYAEADFAEPHNRFVALFAEKFWEEKVDGHVLDLGCGAADVTIRFALAYPDCVIDGIDGAENMLKHGRRAAAAQGLASRVRLHCGLLPEIRLPRPSYDVIISNSLLHHLHEPMVLWETMKVWAADGSVFFVMDLFRPESKEEARRLVEEHARDEPAVLKEDFFNSLCAGFRTEEVDEQLRRAGLGHLRTEMVSDRHFIVYGRSSPHPEGF